MRARPFADRPCEEGGRERGKDACACETYGDNGCPVVAAAVPCAGGRECLPNAALKVGVAGDVVRDDNADEGGIGGFCFLPAGPATAGRCASSIVDTVSIESAEEERSSPMLTSSSGDDDDADDVVNEDL